MHRLLNIVLLVATLGVGWQICAIWTTASPASAPTPTTPRRTRDLPQTVRIPPASRLTVTIAEHDVFDRSRRAPVPVRAETLSPPPKAELLGVMMVGSEAQALIKETNGNHKPRHVFKGADVDGYTVSAISAAQITLTSPSGEVVALPLKTKQSGIQSRKGRRKRGAKRRQRAKTRPTAAGPALQPIGRLGRSRPAASLRARLRELRRKRQAQPNARRR